MKRKSFRNKIIGLILLFLLLGLGGVFSQVNAETNKNSLALTITPPLIKINASRGQKILSFVKVVNNNASSVTVYASVLDFKGDERGGIEFYPPDFKAATPEEKRAFLSGWIDINLNPIKLAPFQSVNIPFQINVPFDAEPGGHYAAILIGTRPMDKKRMEKFTQKGASVLISSQIASLILLRVEGKIVEKARIREFSTDKMFYQKPDVNFKLVFENLGNVHLHPVGVIEIFNMWGKERGKIPINKNSPFGNVLPKSKRVWNFEWKSRDSIFEVGRFKAELILTYGQKAHQTLYKEIYFWVIPLVPTMGFLGGIFFLIALILVSVRLYVKRAVFITQRELGIEPKKIKVTPQVLKAPLKEVVIDLTGLSRREKEEEDSSPKKINLGIFVKKHFRFSLLTLGFAFWILGAILYFRYALKPQKSFLIIQKERGRKIILNSEQILKNQNDRMKASLMNFSTSSETTSTLSSSSLQR